ncbi:hypothetical protein BD310DRAFT_940913, partial [Dichomitus squalens]
MLLTLPSPLSHYQEIVLHVRPALSSACAISMSSPDTYDLPEPDATPTRAHGRRRYKVRVVFSVNLHRTDTCDVLVGIMDSYLHLLVH